MLTPDEYAAVRANVQRHSTSSAVGRACQIIGEYLSFPAALGSLRLREHALFTTSLDVGAMLAALADLFA
jgi:hypothetical protein